MSTPKPGPRINSLHAQILAALLDNKRLATNVAEENVNRAAQRWTP